TVGSPVAAAAPRQAHVTGLAVKAAAATPPPANRKTGCRTRAAAAAATGRSVPLVLEGPASSSAWWEADMGWNHDPDAIHSHKSGEIHALPEKSTPADDDLLLIEDSADSNKKKKVKVANLGGGAETLDDLTDVDTTGVADGDALVYDAGSSTWVPGAGSGGGAAYHETVGDTSETTFSIEHNLDTTAVVVGVIEVSSGDALVHGVDFSWLIVDENEISVTFQSAPGNDDALIVVLPSGGTSSGGGGRGGPWAVDLTDNADAADVVWDGSKAASMTTVTVTGTQTITEKQGVLSVLFSGQGTQDYNCLL